MRRCVSLVMWVAMSASPIVAGAQQPPRPGAPPGGLAGAALPPGCAGVRIAMAPTDSQRRAARDLAQRGQQSAILGDRVSARAQLRDAAALDPSDPDLAYQLARAHDGAGATTEAALEYCRFLSLAPDAPDAPEARERIAVLSAQAQERATVAARAAHVAIPSPATLSPLSPGRALSMGLVVPGGGQFYAGRPVRGVLSFGAAAFAVGYGMRDRLGVTPVTETAIDPFGNPYTFTALHETTSRPHLAQGILVAGAIAVVSAIDAYNFSKRTNEPGGVTIDLVPSGSTLALRLTVR